MKMAFSRPIEPVNLPENSKVEFEIKVADDSQQPSVDDVYAVLDKRYDSGQNDVTKAPRRASATNAVFLDTVGANLLPDRDFRRKSRPV